MAQSSNYEIPDLDYDIPAPPVVQPVPEPMSTPVIPEIAEARAMGTRLALNFFLRNSYWKNPDGTSVTPSESPTRSIYALREDEVDSKVKPQIIPSVTQQEREAMEHIAKQIQGAVDMFIKQRYSAIATLEWSPCIGHNDACESTFSIRLKEHK